ncbi:MAG TPA: thioredoxin [Gaiellaceae bacterium]
MNTAWVGVLLSEQGKRLEERVSGVGNAVTEATFEQEVLKSDKPVLVDFWAEWCGPCHAVSPVLDRIVEERAGAIKLVKVNIDEEMALAQRFGVSSIPTIMLFRDGQAASTAIGAQPKGSLEKTLGLSEG